MACQTDLVSGECEVEHGSALGCLFDRARRLWRQEQGRGSRQGTRTDEKGPRQTSRKGSGADGEGGTGGRSRQDYGETQAARVDGASREDLPPELDLAVQAGVQALAAHEAEGVEPHQALQAHHGPGQHHKRECRGAPGGAATP